MNIDFNNLVSILTTNMTYKNGEVFKRLKFMVNKSTLNFGFSKDELPNCIIVEDWARYYNFDAAKEYDNPSVFVAECILEEALNKLELEAEFEHMMNELEKKHY